MSEQQPQIVVYDPRLSAGRGAAFSAGALVGSYSSTTYSKAAEVTAGGLLRR
jgi:hypothetical protein